MTATTKNTDTILILGETAPVLELAGRMQSRGLRAQCKVTGRIATTPPPQGIYFVRDIPKKLSIAFELTSIDIRQKKVNLLAIEKACRGAAPLVSSAITVTVAEQSSWLKHPEQLAGICGLPTLLSRDLIEISPSRFTLPATVAHIKSVASLCGQEMAIVEDRVGMVMPRILCQLINEAFFAVMEGVASPTDIDIAMKLGTNYPLGPFEWAEKIGLRYVLAVLDSLHTDLGEDRYRIAPLLREMALSGNWWNNK